MEKEGLKKSSRQNLCSLKCQTSNNTIAVVVSSGVTVITPSSHKELIVDLEKLRDDLKNNRLPRIY